ncbi:MAG: type III PLP-dependent enzyme [Acidimicrobiia bacterium]|nr:type III PLP-dependent enzyme [Acidimicrobiia bacterium]NNL28744.1 type III PLP-dependent enzyme [Acidimicrobiia bacterium]
MTDELAAFSDVGEVVRVHRPEIPVMCMHRSTFEESAAEFVAKFDGTVLYAVKANPHPLVVNAIFDGGVRHVDAASIGEIEYVAKLRPDAVISFNNPVKPAHAIRRAYRDFGVRDFVIDHPAELDKVRDETGPDITVQVRVGRRNAEAVIDLNTKFGTTIKEASRLIVEILRMEATPAVSFHVGWQAQDPEAYTRILQRIVSMPNAGELAYINVGGGFPSVLMPPGLTLDDYFAAVSGMSIPLRAEPGSALAASGASLLTRVLLRKERAVYLNDGIYGTLNEHAHYPGPGPHMVLDSMGRPRFGRETEVTVFGPTCDSLDVLPNRYSVPDSTQTGDWILFSQAGAYSNALVTNFNHLGEIDVVEVLTAPTVAR